MASWGQPTEEEKAAVVKTATKRAAMKAKKTALENAVPQDLQESQGPHTKDPEPMSYLHQGPCNKFCFRTYMAMTSLCIINHKALGAHQ